MPLEFIPQKADPRLKGLGLTRRKKEALIVKYGVHFDTFVDGEPVLEGNNGAASEDMYRFNYVQLSKDLIDYKEHNEWGEYRKIIKYIAPKDFFFFCYFVLDLPVNHPFLIARTYEVQECNNMTLDLWARTHWKSTLLTMALPIWEVINDPEERIAIFSHTRSMAKSHLRKIMRTIEKNSILNETWPDIFPKNPRSKGPEGAFKWSEEAGAYLHRKGSYGEATFEAWGLDNLPTGKHFTIMVFDDIVDMKVTNTTTQIRKTIDSYRQADNLAETNRKKKRVIGTRYNLKDPYLPLIEDKRYVKRIFPAEVDESGKKMFQGIPIFMTREQLDDKFQEQKEFTYSAQMLQDPTAKNEYSMNPKWIKYHGDKLPSYMNKYLVVDPAGQIGKSHDYTFMGVIGTDAQGNYHLLDAVRDKLLLKEKWEKIRYLVQKWGLHEVGYERISMQSDIQGLKDKMEHSGLYFNFIELKSNVPKAKRVQNMGELFLQGRFYIPKSLPYKQVDGTYVDIVHEFYIEFVSFPFCIHDDIVDGMSRILDIELGVVFPDTDVYQRVNIAGYDPDPLDWNENQTEVRHWLLA